jgi:hypothetical protein
MKKGRVRKTQRKEKERQRDKEAERWRGRMAEQQNDGWTNRQRWRYREEVQT